MATIKCKFTSWVFHQLLSEFLSCMGQIFLSLVWVTKTPSTDIKLIFFCALVWKPKFLQHSKKWFLAELYMFLITGWSVLHVRLHDLWYGITYNFGIIILFFTDDQFVSSGRSSQRLSFVDDPLSNQRLSFVSVDGSEIDSDYSSASSVVPASSEEQKNLE